MTSVTYDMALKSFWWPQRWPGLLVAPPGLLGALVSPLSTVRAKLLNDLKRGLSFMHDAYFAGRSPYAKMADRFAGMSYSPTLECPGVAPAS